MMVFFEDTDALETDWAMEEAVELMSSDYWLVNSDAESETMFEAVSQ